MQERKIFHLGVHIYMIFLFLKYILAHMPSDILSDQQQVSLVCSRHKQLQTPVS